MTEKDPLAGFTGAGKLLVFATGCFALAAFGLVVSESVEILPSGRYPVALFACAIAPVALVFYLVGALLLRLLGIRIHELAAEQRSGPPPA